MHFPRRRGVTIAAIIVSLVIGQHFHSRAAGQSVSEEKVKLKSELLRKTSEYLKILKGYQCKSTTTTVDANGKTVYSFEDEIRQGNGCSMLITHHDDDSSPKADLSAINPRYSFRLEKAKAGGDWKLISMGRSTPIAQAVRPFGSLKRKDYALTIMSPYNVELAWLPDLLDDPTVNVVEIVRGKESASNSILVTYGKADDKNGKWQGSVTIDADNWFVVNEYEETLERNGGKKVVKCQNHFDFNSASIPLLKKRTKLHRSVVQGADVIGTQTTNLSFERKALEEDDFTLSALGMLEPEWARKPKGFNWLQTAMMIVVGVFGAFLILQLAKKKRTIP